MRGNLGKEVSTSTNSSGKIGTARSQRKVWFSDSFLIFFWARFVGCLSFGDRPGWYNDPEKDCC